MDELLEQFKNRMHITHAGEDGSIEKLLSFSVAYVKSKCGNYEEYSDDIKLRARELVLERTRYSYNDAVEYFEDNFLSDIISLGVEMAGVDNVEE